MDSVITNPNIALYSNNPSTTAYPTTTSSTRHQMMMGRSTPPPPLSTTSHVGSTCVVGGVEEVSGMSYAAISPLSRQYESPVGQRVLLFVRTNANCCLQGGVETILKFQKSNHHAKPQTTTTTTSGSENQNLDTPYYGTSHNHNPPPQEGGDPFSFLQENDPDPYNSTNNNNGAGAAGGGDPYYSSSTTTMDNSAKKKGPNLGRFLKKVAKQTTATLERGMHELAIKADQGRTPDLLTAGLFYDTHNATSTELIAMTDSVPLPRPQRVPNGVGFAIPLWIPPRIDDSSTVTIKLFISSQASLMITSATGKTKTKHFLLGHTQVHVGQLRQMLLQQRQAFLALNLASHLIADGQLHLCVLPDLKIPSSQRGWSLTDPRFSGFASGLYNIPLDQSYLFDTPPLPHLSGQGQGQGQGQGNQWLIATERAMESTVVLPLAAAYAQLCAQACHVSVLHSHAIASQLLAKRTEQKDPGTCAQVTVELHFVQLEQQQPQSTQQQQVVNVTLAWQPPDSIFELELLPNVQLPLAPPRQQPTPQQVQQLPPPPSLKFFPPLCTQGVLPAILKAYGGRMPPNTGYMLGNLRLQFSFATTATSKLKLPTSSTSSTNASAQTAEVWECLIVLEQHIPQPNNQTPQPQEQTARPFPVYSLSSGHKMGTIFLNLAIYPQTTPAVPVPPPVSPQQGLVALVGLEHLVQGVAPSVDFEDASILQPQFQNAAHASAAALSEETRRRHLQLATMGNFVSHAYLDQHIRSRRQADWQLFQERAKQYQTALDRAEAGTTAATTSVGVGGEPLPAYLDMSPKPFRPSSSRPEVLLSSIPFNTHTASLSLDVMEPNQNSSGMMPPQQHQQQHQQLQPDGALFHNITCGAPADHASGFGNVFLDKTFTSPIGSVSGGLRRLESKRQELAQVVKTAQTQLINGVAQFFQTARQQQQYLNHVPARHSQLQNMRWKVFEAVHAYHHVTWICAVRRANAFSQALGIAVTSYLTSLSDVAKCQVGWPELWARHGYLVSFEGLLSAAGKELGMIEDASVAINMLHMVKIVLVPDDGSSSSSSRNADPGRVIVPHSPLLKWVHLLPSPNGSNTQYLLQIGIHAHYYEQRIPPCLRNGTTVQLYPLLFQVGVDIRQWGAHAGSQMKNQFATSDLTSRESSTNAAVGNGGDKLTGGGLLDEEDDDVGELHDDVLVALNYEALQKMNSYAHLISPQQSDVKPSGNPFDAFVEPASQQQQQQQLSGMSVHPSLSMLHSHIITSAGKMNHSILDEAATMAQQLGGGGIVFCKSGKDRTAMHVTFKQAQFVNRFRQQKYSNQEILDTTLEDATRMRIYGTRLPICEKNVGQALYAFNSLQSKFMPDALKPPPSTLAGFLKGGRVFGQGGIES